MTSTRALFDDKVAELEEKDGRKWVGFMARFGDRWVG
jgi:hypothetical protein